MPDRDIDLIKEWIGLGVPGAQCEPNPQNRGCVTTRVGNAIVNKIVECNNGMVGADIQICAANEACSYFTGNGQCVARGQ